MIKYDDWFATVVLKVNLMTGDDLSQEDFRAEYESNMTTEEMANSLCRSIIEYNDFPLGDSCDLSGEGDCEACQ